jgi:fibrillarin-like rRNA methylase
MNTDAEYDSELATVYRETVPLFTIDKFRYREHTPSRLKVQAFILQPFYSTQLQNEDC